MPPCLGKRCYTYHRLGQQYHYRSNPFKEIVDSFETQYMVSGLAPFGEYLVVLGYIESKPEDKDDDDEGAPIELFIISHDNEEISSDAIPIKAPKNSTSKSFRLDHMRAESLYYIVSPSEIVLAKPRDLDDHIRWLMDPARTKYEEALEAAEKNEGQLKSFTLIGIGETYLNYLLQNHEEAKAAALCPRILKRDKDLWEKWIIKFTEKRKTKEIGPYIPIANPQLKSYIYEVVLSDFLRHDHKGFCTLITEWPHTIYNIHTIITAVEARAADTSDALLMDALATLFTYDKQFDKTLHIYLRLKRATAFQLIDKHNLFHAIQDKVKLLLECNEEQAIKLLVEHVDKIPVRTVVQQLMDQPRLLHAYLHNLFVKDPHAGEEFNLLRIELYAKFDYRQLKPFLIHSIYPLEKAYKVVEERKLYPEMVYILARMGNTRDALDLLIEKIGDVKQAIEFVQEQRDEELWEDLIAHSMRNPKFVSGLLEHIGACESVSPLDLIRRIPEGLKIDHLRDRLVKIISDYNLQMSLRKGCNQILKEDCVNLIQRLWEGQKRGMRVPAETATCSLCSGPVTHSKDGGELVVFFCRHIYHTKCLTLAMHGQHGGQSGAGAPGAAVGSVSTVSGSGGPSTSTPASASAAAAAQGDLRYDRMRANATELSARAALELNRSAMACLICNQHTTRPSRASTSEGTSLPRRARRAQGQQEW
jgi:tetratricopeptide (TPR) repeat protein